MKLVIGMIIGLVLGTTVSALAISGFEDSAGIFKSSRQYRLGYVAGTYDTLQTVSDSPDEDYTRIAVCLRGKSTNLGPLTDWAEARWAKDSSPYQAASTIINQACQ